MNKSEFIPTIAPMVQKENQKRGYPLFSSVVIAQAICESAWGQSSIMMKANAIFGIKATSSWKGRVYNAQTRECYDGATYTNINACFRAYDKLEDSISDYFDLITKSSRYEKALHCANAEECIKAIKKGGYATDPTYVNKILSIINSNNLKQYDVETVENGVENSNVPQNTNSDNITYTVVSGDTLSKIASKYGTTYQKIYSDNKDIIDNENIKRGVDIEKMWLYPGQELQINKNVPQQTNPRNVMHTVVSGETLSAIACRYGTKYQNIYTDNKSIIDSENRKRGVDTSKMWIYPGQVLKINL